VKGYLFDTNIALLGLAAPERIPGPVREAVEGQPVYLSVLSYWEVLLKSMKGRLDVGEPRTWWIDALDKLGATPLPLRPDHISAICELPPIHQDPFDRALVAQAATEGLTLVTTDKEIVKYTSERFRILS
jgi:PIN domain nuclease of toxin-antitoxin system